MLVTFRGEGLTIKTARLLPKQHPAQNCSLPTCVLNSQARLNPLHPNISIRILHTALCTFTKVLTRRIC